MDRKTDGVFLTGATGFVGMELLARYLERTDRRVYALVRGADDREAAARMERTLLCLFGPDHPYARAGGRRARRHHAPRPGPAGPGSTGSPSGSARSCTARRPCPSSSSLQACARRSTSRARGACSSSPSAARRAAACGASPTSPRRTSPASTRAASARTTSTSASAFATPTSSRSSRRSACVARCARASCRSRCCARASSSASATAAGRRRSTCSTGRCARSRAAPTRRCRHARDAPVDVVPVDYVADAIFALSQAPEAEGATFHLTAGAHASSVGELVELATAVLRTPGAPPDRAVAVSACRAPAARCAQPATSAHRRALTRSEVFFPYFAMRRVATTIVAPAWRCAGRGSGPTPLRTYFDRLVEFALAAEWGRRQIPRVSAVAGVTITQRPAGTPAPRTLEPRLALAE